MKSTFCLLFSVTLIAFAPMRLHSWGLLQGRVGSQIANEHNRYVQGMFLSYDPFYAGPLLAPSAYVVPRGYVNFQPYFFWQRKYGEYDRTWHKVRTRSSLQFRFLTVTQVGLTKFMEFSSTSAVVINRKQDQQHSGYGDTLANLGFQLLEGIRGKPIPACKFVVGVLFPTGRHDGLKESRLGVDETGSGAYGTVFSLNFQKNFDFLFRKDFEPKSFHPFRIRWSFGYSINSRAKVKGINAYGGDRSTRGTVKVGNNFTSIFSWEFSFTEHWVWATDWQYTATAPSRFSGNTGSAKVGQPASQNWSVAPALEYNFNDKLGALIGAWFSLGGRNSNGFVTGIVSFTYLF